MRSSEDFDTIAMLHRNLQPASGSAADASASGWGDNVDLKTEGMRTSLAALARLISGASVRWIDCQPDTCQRVYFANHTSHLDVLVLWASLPRKVRNLTRPVAAKDYWEKGFVRRFIAMNIFDALLIDRKEIKVHQSPVDLMLKSMGDRYSLIVFPEGHRNTGPDLDEFKSGLYYLAKKRPDLELVPVHIDNVNRVLPRGEFLPVPLLSCITFGPPMWLENQEPKMDFLRRARNAVRRLKDL
ncbi:MAG TPA: lysophospholipid acyltransferase family protein [Pirellulales bacterium]|nr:lysophospholipid acyltransferase family protein [Pirellulales bacterium]